VHERFLQALREARPDGTRVRAWSVFFNESRNLTLGAKDREIGNAHVPLRVGESCGARYRLIWEDGAVSRGYAERRMLEQDPAGALAQARAAAYDDPDAAWVLGPAPVPEVETFDPGAAALAGGDTVSIEPRIASICRRVEECGLRTWSGSFSAGVGDARVVTSAGLDVAGRATLAGWHVTYNGELGDGYSARSAESAADFEARLDRLVETVRRMDRPAGPREGGVRPVVLHPGVDESYVLDTLLANLGGSTVAHGEGHFRKEQFGSGVPVLREDIALRLDPLVPLRRGSYRFTTEGVPAARCTYVERGRLVQPLLDLKYARRLGLAPTPLPLGTDTLVFEGAEAIEREAALRTAAGGALILSVLGVHTQDSASGDFSLSAPQALALDADGPAGRMRATISGNLFRILAGDALRFVRFEGETTPGLLFPCRVEPR
jgi:PmbA protein